MKPGKNDHKIKILITGRELKELKPFTFEMAESFGLDDRIENYQGKLPIGLYRWDVECLLNVIFSVLSDKNIYPSKDSQESIALNNLYNRLKKEYELFYE